MSNQFLGEIRLFSGNFAPRGWALCQGQLLAISQNTALYSLLGTTYGGNGQSTFALPNMTGNVPLHPGQGAGLSAYSLGQTGGSATVTLTTPQIAAHTHAFNADSGQAALTQPGGNYLGAGPGRQTHLYADAGTAAPMAADIVGLGGGGQPHPNQQPLLVLTFIIALTGIYPPRP